MTKRCGIGNNVIRYDAPITEILETKDERLRHTQALCVALVPRL